MPKISDLPSAITLTGAELFPADQVQATLETVKVSANQIAAFVTAFLGTSGVPIDKLAIGAGGLTVAGKVGINTTAPDALLTVNANTSPTTPGILTPGTIIHAIGKFNVNARVVIDAFTAAGQALIRRAEGDASSPATIAAGSILANFGASGWDGSGYTTNATAAIRMVAQNAWAPTDTSTYLSVITTPVGAFATVEALRVQPSGGLTVGKSGTDPGTGNIWLDGDSIVANSGVQFYYDSANGAGAFQAWVGGSPGIFSLNPFGGMIGFGNSTPQTSLDIRLHANAGDIGPAYAPNIVRIAGADGGATYVSLETFQGTAAFQGRRADGTAANPLPVGTADPTPLASFQAYGWNGTSYNTQSPAASIDLDASEDFTPTANGSHIRFRTTPVGTIGPQITNMVLYGDGGLLLGDNAAGPLHVNQFASPGRYVVDINAVATITDVSPVPTGSQLRLAGGSLGVPLGFTMDSFGAGCLHAFRRANGSAGARTAMAANDVLGTQVYVGWNGAAYSPFAAVMQVMAAEPFTASANGTVMNFQTTPIGSTAKGNSFVIFPSGGVGIGRTPVDPGLGGLSIGGLAGTGGLLMVAPSGVVTASSVTGVASAPASFVAGHYIPVNVGGTTVFLPFSSTAW
jgi:hypothetical protein